MSPRKLLTLAWALLAVAPAGCEDDGGNGFEEDLFFADRVLNIAHQGGALLAPEETMLAFQNAVDVGADVLELDLHATSDGVIICMHDDTVDRTTNGTGEISSLTFEEIRALDAGYQFTTDEGATYPHRGSGLVVPSFEEVLDAFPNQYFVVEIKQDAPSIVNAVVDLINARGMMEQMVMGSFHDAVLEEFRQAAPDALTSFGTVEMTEFVFITAGQEDTYEPPALFLQAPDAVVEETFMERARRFDLKVHVWTVNDRTEMERFIELGVDGIITDDPATLRDVIGG